MQAKLMALDLILQSPINQAVKLLLETAKVMLVPLTAVAEMSHMEVTSAPAHIIDLIGKWTRVIHTCQTDATVLPACFSLKTEYTSFSSSDSYYNMSIYRGADYNPEQKEHCPTSCGSMDIPFPFGLKEGCYANKKFRLNCTADNTTVFSLRIAQYSVIGVSVENGTLTVGKVLNKNETSAREVMVVENNEFYNMVNMEDDFDFSMEYGIVIRWVATNSTCQQASQKNTKYACRSVHSYCQHVTHGRIFMGYRCKCSSGFHGNPYIQDGCTGSYLPYASNIICPLH
jgi:hypothetical protein